MAVLYFVMQILGGIAAGGLLKALLNRRVYDLCKGGTTFLTAYARVNGTNADGTAFHWSAEYVTWWEGLVLEIIVTFVLVTVILMVALDTKAKTGLAPLIIGLALAACILAAGNFTGGSLNPARSLGPAIFANKEWNHWNNMWIYWLGPLVGAVLAGVLYRFIWAHHDRRYLKRTTLAK